MNSWMREQGGQASYSLTVLRFGIKCSYQEQLLALGFVYDRVQRRCAGGLSSAGEDGVHYETLICRFTCLPLGKERVLSLSFYLP